MKKVIFIDKTDNVQISDLLNELYDLYKITMSYKHCNRFFTVMDCSLCFVVFYLAMLEMFCGNLETCLEQWKKMPKILKKIDTVPGDMHY